MLRLFVVAAVVPALALAAASAPAGVTVVNVSTRGFEPAALSIHAGDTVTWTNSGSIEHQVASDNGAFQPSPVLQPGQSWSFTFRKKGRFAYHDELHLSLQGTVAVAAAPPSVTIGAARTGVAYGGTGLTLSGRISSHRSGQRLVVLARTCGEVDVEQAGVVTRRGGDWRLVVHPLRTTQYGVRWNRIPSAAFRVGVQPRIHLAHANGAYPVEVRAATAFTGRTIVLQRFDEAEQSWDIVATAKLQSAGLTTPPTILSTATLKSSTGGRVRALLSPAQAAPCYAQSTSNAMVLNSPLRRTAPRRRSS